MASKKEQVRNLIVNMTIAEFGQPKSPEEAIEKRGYERARFAYAEEKIKLIKVLEQLL